MTNSIKPENIVFLDIETVPQEERFENLDSNKKELWTLKAERLRSELSAEELYPRAGIYAEFGRIISISCGALFEYKGGFSLELKSFYHKNEKHLLSSFIEYLNTKGSQIHLCAHNGKEFDFPYLCRRMIINNLKLPKCLDISGKKPWEVKHLDTMEMWKFGDWKSYTSLDLLAQSLELESPKNELDGSKVYEEYYANHGLNRIVEYCERDVSTLVQVYLKLSQMEKAIFIEKSEHKRA